MYKAIICKVQDKNTCNLCGAWTKRVTLKQDSLKSTSESKKGFESKIWNAVVFQVNSENDVPKEPKKNRKRKATEQQPLAHTRKSQQIFWLV